MADNQHLTLSQRLVAPFIFGAIKDECCWNVLSWLHGFKFSTNEALLLRHEVTTLAVPSSSPQCRGLVVSYSPFRGLLFALIKAFFYLWRIRLRMCTTVGTLHTNLQTTRAASRRPLVRLPFHENSRTASRPRTLLPLRICVRRSQNSTPRIRKPRPGCAYVSPPSPL